MQFERDERKFDFHDIGREIKRKREASGMTQEQLACIIDRDPRTVMYHENCYLLAHSQRHGVTSYRVDRMTNITLSEEKRLPCPELTGAALVEHANRLFQMFAGDAVDVKLRFHRSLTNAVMDRFGHETMFIPDGEEHFVFTVRVAVSPMFLSWLIGFGNKAKILHPQSVIEAYKDLCREALDQY